MGFFGSLGLEEDWIYECIVSVDVEGRWIHLPLGVSWMGPASLGLRVYKVSKAYSSFLEKKDFLIHFPSRIDDIYDAVLDRGSLVFEDLDGFPVLRDSFASLKAKVSSVQDMGDKLEVCCEAVDLRLNGPPKLVNRAEGLALEALIDYTKLPYVSEDRRAFLLAKIKEAYRVICISAPQSKYQALVESLLERLR